tara:strand:- start:76 stop:309 length:234 start_codon:yes stop_codon:yes gene_type:complete
MKANTKKRINMYQLEKNLVDELNENKQEILDNENLLYKYVDSHIPVYNAYDIIAHNIYEKLMEKAQSWLNDNQKEVA